MGSSTPERNAQPPKVGPAEAAEVSDVRAGAGLRRFGIVLLGIGFVCAWIPETGDDTVDGITGLATLVLLPIGAFVYYRGRQHRARAWAKDVLHDRIPDVLYLRAFDADASTTRAVFSVFLRNKLTSGLASEEEQLAEALAPFGSLVAIGEPGEKLPTPGAARLYVGHDEWKAVVEKQMLAARLVILRAGETPGLVWELERGAEILPPARLLVFVCRLPRKRYEAFRQVAEPALGVALPAFKEMGRRFRRLYGFIVFDEDWKPRLLPLKAPFWRASSIKPLRPMVHHTLRPVFDAQAVPWEPSPLGWARVITAGMLGLIALVLGLTAVLALVAG